MEPFARYGFNKSHSAAYAYIAYQTAYLKAHYPVEFMTANLSADMGDTEKVVKLIGECKHMSIEILPPDINESEREFKIVGNSVRFGLEAVKGVGSSAIDVMIQDRQDGPFRSFEDFLTRMDSKKVNKKVVESLIKAGAFDSLFSESPFVARGRAMDALLSPATTKSLGMSLFGEPEPSAGADSKSWDEPTILKYEKEALGFYLSGHPLSRYRRTLAGQGVITISGIEERAAAPGEGQEVTVAGMIGDMRNRAREKGVTAYLTIEDETASCEVLVFPDLYRKHTDLLRKGAGIIVRGQLFSAEKGTKIIAREIQNLDGVELTIRYEVSVGGSDTDELTRKLKGIRKYLGMNRKAKENCSLYLRVVLPEYCVVITSQLQPANNFREEVERITGNAVRVL
ncbi:MAG TPA: OB-fold nucleic acid binding domain-containing protein, partial [Dissulfurispiraceae bacterium]|nr:OB-fold nucleic acid binding domain-containing protein [Dissulfurispiraceae bacterium]